METQRQVIIVEQHPKGCEGNNYNFKNLEACIILERTKISLTKSRSKTPVQRPPSFVLDRRKPVFVERGEGGSGYGAFGRSRGLRPEAEWSELLRRGSSKKERKGNALASGADEGRDKLR